jgi:DNA-binding response OmpR family regulator
MMSVPPRILYVDDDLAACEMLSFWLREDCGFDVTAAADGKQAEALIGSEYFDLFILDYCLPDTTAVTLCGRIKEVNSSAPILIYSALDREVDRDKAIAAGANVYLVKPDQLGELRPRVEGFLGRHSATAVASEAATLSLPIGNDSQHSSTAKRRASGIV